MNLSILIASLIAPFLYAFTNHIDKALLDRYFTSGGVGTLILFSSILSCLALPIIYILEPSAWQVDPQSALTLAFVGVLNVILLWCYLQAMAAEDPTVVIIFYQLVPVIGLALSYLVLGETITTLQAAAMLTIIIGATIMTVSSDQDGKIELRLRPIKFMLVASLCWAAEATFFKKVALEENVLRSLFWENLTMAMIGGILFVGVPHYRRSLLSALRVNSRPIIGLNVLNEGLYMLGNAAASLVVVLIPVALNLLMNSFQPIFVFVIGVVLSRFLPSYATEASGDRWIQKLSAIALTGTGVYLIGEW